MWRCNGFHNPPQALRRDQAVLPPHIDLGPVDGAPRAATAEALGVRRKTKPSNPKRFRRQTATKLLASPISCSVVSSKWRQAAPTLIIARLAPSGDGGEPRCKLAGHAMNCHWSGPTNPRDQGPFIAFKRLSLWDIRGSRRLPGPLDIGVLRPIEQHHEKLPRRDPHISQREFSLFFSVPSLAESLFSRRSLRRPQRPRVLQAPRRKKRDAARMASMTYNISIFGRPSPPASPIFRG